MKTTLCTVGVEHPMVCGSPHTRLRIGRADRPGITIIDWPNITMFRYGHPNLSRRIEQSSGTVDLTDDELDVICRVSTFNAWPKPTPAVLNPHPHYIDFLPWPEFAKRL